jgi:hypothetical protein
MWTYMKIDHRFNLISLLLSLIGWVLALCRWKWNVIYSPPPPKKHNTYFVIKRSQVRNSAWKAAILTQVSVDFCPPRKFWERTLQYVTTIPFYIHDHLPFWIRFQVLTAASIMVGCCAMQSCRSWPTSLGSLLPPSSKELVSQGQKVG